MANFFAVPAEALEGYLQSLRFERSVYGQEVVYSRKSAYNPNVLIKVYTSIRVGQSSVRAAGTDAIRVCCVFDNGRRSFGIGKFPPVMRVASVDSVLKRLFERLQAAAARAKAWMAEEDRRNGVSSRDQAEWQARVEEKAAYARFEAEQERRAFASDPDFRADTDPCSEPPESGNLAYEGYASRVSCPDGCC